MNEKPNGMEGPADSGGTDLVSRSRFSTRGRLIAAFSAVLVAFLSALAFQVFALRRMEATFAAMEERDAQMQLALQLEDAVRDQYGHEAGFVMGERARLAEYEMARSRASRLLVMLNERVDEPDAVVWLDQIRKASEELDSTFRDRVAPAVQNRDPAAAVT